MAWWNDYDRSDRGYGGGYGRPYYGGRAGWGTYDRDYTTYGAYGWGGYGRDYDRTYRVPPERSPTYGRQADQAARRWARRHGYDAGYTVEPRSTGYTAGRTGTWNRGYRVGRDPNWGYRAYDWGYSWLR